MQKVLFKEVAKHKYLYLLVAPVLVYYILFAYLPMYGIVLAFKDFDYSKGITGSPWVGFKHFQEVMQYSDFWKAFNNTLIISAGRLIFQFPAPIILALLLNEVTRIRLKKFYQTVFTFPHFLSWVILGGIITNFLGDSGVFNQLLLSLGFEKRNLLVDPSSFRYLMFITDIWREIGWSFLDTYVYRYTFITGDSFSISTAVGLIKSTINFALLIGANYLVRYMGEEGVT